MQSESTASKSYELNPGRMTYHRAQRTPPPRLRTALRPHPMPPSLAEQAPVPGSPGHAIPLAFNAGPGGVHPGPRWPALHCPSGVLRGCPAGPLGTGAGGGGGGG